VVQLGPLLGYITGVIHTGRGYCIPDGATYGQEREIIIRALEAQPHRRHLLASDFIIAEMRKVWPCKPSAIPQAPQTLAETEPGEITVIDGDTIRFRGLTIRLIGFDTPETRRAKCPQVRTLGERAKARLEGLVVIGGLTLKLAPCACRLGTQGTQACNYGRSCGYLKANGRDVAEILIEDGLARPFHCGAKSCPPLQPWC
jgi:micrococcal nuclease